MMSGLYQALDAVTARSWVYFELLRNGKSMEWTKFTKSLGCKSDNKQQQHNHQQQQQPNNNNNNNLTTTTTTGKIYIALHLY